jgi:hypothetical protein
LSPVADDRTLVIHQESVPVQARNAENFQDYAGLQNEATNPPKRYGIEADSRNLPQVSGMLSRKEKLRDTE